MKAKNLIILLMVLMVVLFYNLFCYHFVNKVVDNESRYVITNYFKEKCNGCSFTYDYKKAVVNNDNSISIYVKYNSLETSEYYRFVIVRSMGTYMILDVNNNIPAYIK